jgi:uncharacterized protein
VTSSIPDRQSAKAALWLLAGHNLIQNRLLNEGGYVTGNLAVTAGLILIGRHAGLRWDEMGLGRGDLRKGFSIGATVALASFSLAVLISRLPAVGSRLHDERVATDSVTDAVRRAVTRFPLGTALFEEVSFRGVLPPLLARGGATPSGDLASAVAFAVWHLIPTHHALTINDVGESGWARLGGTVMGAAAAGFAGYGLSWLRRKTGSLLAPWLVHGSVNAASYLGVALSRSRDARREAGQRP